MTDRTDSIEKEEYFPGEFFESILKKDLKNFRGDFCVKDPEKKALPGELILMCGYAGLSGACALVKEKKEILLKRFSKSYLDRDAALKILEKMPKASDILQEKGAYVLSAREGGIFGCLFDLSKKNHLGFTVDMKKIPVIQQTIEICNCLGGNPYKLYSYGSYIASVPAEEAPEYESLLKAEEIPFAFIGVTRKGVKKILMRGEEVRYLERPSRKFVLKMESVI